MRIRLRLRRLAVVAVAVLAASCTSAPTLPSADNPTEIHDLLTGPKGAEFLLDISTHEWPDGGAQPARLFDWVPRDAAAAEVATAERAGATAQALASFLATKESDLLKIGTGWFSADKTAGGLNPQLVKAYAAALIPYQGAFACDKAAVPGFEWYGSDCSTAVTHARAVFTALNTDSDAAKNFADAAGRRMDSYLARFAAGVADPSKLFEDGPALAGTLLGLLRIGSNQSGIEVETVQDLENRADYLVASALIPPGSNPGLPPEYLADGKLASPQQIRQNLGAGEMAAYYASLRTYLAEKGGLQTRLSSNLRDAYHTAAGT